MEHDRVESLQNSGGARIIVGKVRGRRGNKQFIINDTNYNFPTMFKHINFSLSRSSKTK